MAGNISPNGGALCTVVVLGSQSVLHSHPFAMTSKAASHGRPPLTFHSTHVNSRLNDPEVEHLQHLE